MARPLQTLVAMNDLRHALRQLRRRPGFSTLVIITLALGIGATTAVFSVVNCILIQPLPYPNADRLISVWNRATFQGVVNDRTELSPPMYFAYAEHNETLEEFGVYSRGVATVTGLGDPEQVRTFTVTHEVLPAFGVKPLLGRSFSAEDDTPGTPTTAILTYAYWQRRFGGDPAVLGRTIEVDSVPRGVIGVMPRGFDVGDGAELILPQRFDRGAVLTSALGYYGLARVEPGVTLDQVEADLARALTAGSDEFGLAGAVERLRISPAARPLKQDVVGNIGNVLWMVLGAIGLVLLIACANVANLLLVRAEGRSQELATRAALGAGSGRIARLLLLESVTLGLVGGLAGLAVAQGLIRILVALGPANLPRITEIAIDLNALAFTLFVSIMSGVAFGLAAALKHSGSRSIATTGLAGRTVTASRERNRSQNVLVVAQFALAFVLLIGAGLMIRSFEKLLIVDPGFARPEQVQTLQVAISAAEVPEPERAVRMQHDMLEQISAVPGVSSAAFATVLPTVFSGNMPIAAEGVTPENSFPGLRRTKFVSPGYFATLGTPLLAGRDFTWSDVYQRHAVAIVSAKMARETWGDASAALGKRIRIGTGTSWNEVVGVAADVHEDGASRDPPAMVYWRAGIFPIFTPDDISRGIAFAVRTERAGTESLVNEIERAVWSVDRNVPIASVRTLRDMWEQTLASASFTLVMLGIAGAMALGLGIVGIYGAVAYTVARRNREIGLRIALGAHARDIRRLFVRHGLSLASLGVAAGLAAATGLTRLMGSLLFGVSPLDPLTYAAGAIVLLVAAVVASVLPVHRALAKHPVEALRSE
jgi:putative ABC transport system permease protein